MFGCLPMSCTCVLLMTCSMVMAQERQTRVSIRGEDFLINDELTYKDCQWRGNRIEGLLLNMRVVQAAFDDRNPETVTKWAYPDTQRWDAERNVREFIEALPVWKSHGLLAVTINLQGGSPEGYSSSQPWITGAFDPDGALRSDYRARLTRVLDAADREGMVVILGYFYFGQDQHLSDEAAVKNAVQQATDFILDGGWTNVLVEVNNETDVKAYDHAVLKPDRVHELIMQVKSIEKSQRRLLVGTSYGGGSVPGKQVIRTSDFILMHGNGVADPQRIAKMIDDARHVEGYRLMPILFNEDDHEGFDKGVNNFSVAISKHVSWGWFDYRRKGEAFEEGYQNPPVDWGINSQRKKDFFRFLQEVACE